MLLLRVPPNRKHHKPYFEALMAGDKAGYYQNIGERGLDSEGPEGKGGGGGGALSQPDTHKCSK